MNRWMNGEKGQDAHDPEIAIQRHKIIRTLKHKRTQIHNAAESSVAYGIPWMFQAFDLWMRRIFRSDAHKNGFSDHVISSWIRSLGDSELRSHGQIKKIHFQTIYHQNHGAGHIPLRGFRHASLAVGFFAAHRVTSY